MEEGNGEEGKTGEYSVDGGVARARHQSIRSRPPGNDREHSWAGLEGQTEEGKQGSATPASSECQGRRALVLTED